MKISATAFELQELLELASQQAAELAVTQRKISRIISPELLETLDTIAELSVKLSGKKPPSKPGRVALQLADGTPNFSAAPEAERIAAVEYARNELQEKLGVDMLTGREAAEFVGSTYASVMAAVKEPGSSFPRGEKYNRYRFFRKDELQAFKDSGNLMFGKKATA